jgi:lipoprotein-anchoring transpeptidase ErfK/SrfK
VALHQLLIDVPRQQLLQYIDGHRVKQYAVATSAKGVGQQLGSEQTPVGWHQVWAKIGTNCPANTVFVGRRATGESYNQALAYQYPNRDWILTRIFWLKGLEPGVNRFGSCDTLRRYIYIHGVPSSKPMGQPGSKGCINMHNNDIIELYSKVPVGAWVLIKG